jgi:alanine racemase
MSGHEDKEPSLAAAGALLTVDLAALRANYRMLAARLRGGARAAAVLKADGYGLGGAKIGSALRAEGCDFFFVALLAEAIDLRAALGDRPAIQVLNGIAPGAEEECIAAGVTPVLNSLEQLSAWHRAAERAGRRLGATLQVDSGMARIGMPASEVERLAATPALFERIEIGLVMSHLACADEPQHPANRAQLAEFLRLKALLPQAPASLANSSGIFLGEEFHFDVVRPGAALYGVNPIPGRPNPMRQVVRLEAKILQTRELPAGAGVGYGHSFHAERPMRAATIALGYGDGWPRRASGAAWHGDARLPFIGRVSMDSIILDITGLGDELPAGTRVELIGPHQTVDEVAALAGTIGYEILTALGRRFHRIYVDGNAPVR